MTDSSEFIFTFRTVTLEIIGLDPEIPYQQVYLQTHLHEGRAERQVQDLGMGVNLELVSIPGGTFTMGSPMEEERRQANEGPLHKVTIQPFWLGQYTVTQAQWKAVAAMPAVHRDLHPNPSQFKHDSYPVECVSWYDASEFCERLSQYTGRRYRLPSEAEWEYACRAGTTTPFHYGVALTIELANYQNNFRYSHLDQLDNDTDGAIYSIARKQQRHGTVFSGGPPNAFGLYNMHGNVSEWCLDDWHETYEGAPTDGSAWLTLNESVLSFKERVMRGGSWDSDWDCCRSAYRQVMPADCAAGTVGFRVACTDER